MSPPGIRILFCSDDSPVIGGKVGRKGKKKKGGGKVGKAAFSYSLDIVDFPTKG